MRKFKFIALFCMIAAGYAFYNQTNAQFENSTLSPRINQIKQLLKQEIASNSLFADNKDALDYTLNNSDDNDLIATDCPKYAGLLYYSMNTNALFVNYYNIQGNFGYEYSFVENNKPTLISLNFYEMYDDNGNFQGLTPSVKLINYNQIRTLEDGEAIDYITTNICQPLNRFLDTNGNAPSPDVLNKMKQYFTK